MENTQVRTIHKKILEIMKEVQYIQKDTQIKFGRTNYRALSEEKVTTLIREQFIKHGLVFYPVHQEYSRHGDVSVLNITYHLVDTESGEHIEISSTGEGKDNSDKGAGKASTYAYKYALLRLFAIPTGDDPDMISTEEHIHNDNIEKEAIQRKMQLINNVNTYVQQANVNNVDPNYIYQFMMSTVGRPFNTLEELSENELQNILNGFSSF